MLLFVVFVITTMLTTVLAECPGKKDFLYDDDVIARVCDENFQDFLSGGDVPSVVEFYAPWCGHCQHLKPIYSELAEKMKGQMAFAAADCTNARALCGRYGVSGYPTLRVFPRKSDSSRSARYAGSRQDAETMKTYLLEEFSGEEDDLDGPVFPDEHRPRGGGGGTGTGRDTKKESSNKKKDITDPDMATSIVDVDITTLIRVGVFSMYLGNAISLFSTSSYSNENVHAISREFQSPFFVAIVFAFHMTVAFVSLLRPCSLITAMSVAWGYYESLLFIDESASNFLVRAPFWITPLSLLWLQVRGGTADFCGEDAVLITRHVVSTVGDALGMSNVAEVSGWVTMLWFVLVLFVLFVVFGESTRLLFGKRKKKKRNTK
ncbi:protein disulfide isomerase family protein [bacterium]|nr:protein disulfide isomerase family protein [bacterium]